MSGLRFSFIFVCKSSDQHCKECPEPAFSTVMGEEDGEAPLVVREAFVCSGFTSPVPQVWSNPGGCGAVPGMGCSNTIYCGSAPQLLVAVLDGTHGITA